MNKNKRPLRDYSYTAPEEFLADAFASYNAKEKKLVRLWEILLLIIQ